MESWHESMSDRMIDHKMAISFLRTITIYSGITSTTTETTSIGSL